MRSPAQGAPNREEYNAKPGDSVGLTHRATAHWLPGTTSLHTQRISILKTAITSLVRRLVGTPGLDSRLANIEQALQQKSEVPAAPPARSLCGSMTEVRKTIADNFIAGQGLEIGAFASPLPVPAAARVTYVDKYNLDDLDANH